MRIQKGDRLPKALSIPRKGKKGFKKWLLGVRGITLNPMAKNINAIEVLQDMYALFKAKNCLGKPLYSTKNNL